MVGVRDGAGLGRPRPRVFLGPIEIAGYYAGLERCLRAANVDAVAVDLSVHPFRYAGAPGARRPLAARPAAAVAKLVTTVPALGRWRPVRRALQAVAAVPLLVWAIFRFDVFVFGFRTSFFGLREIALLHRLGKRLVFVFHGSDARPPYVDGADMDEAVGLSIDGCARLAARKKHEIRRIERYAEAMLVHPLYGHFFERPYVRFTAVGTPAQRIAAGTALARGEGSAPPRALHSPSNPAVKGTTRIREAIATLAADGLTIDYVEVAGKPNAVVLEEIAKADFVIDQLYSDIPMATFTTEAAWQARPAVVGSYGWDELERLLPADERAPVEACHPDASGAAIRALATEPARTQALGGAVERYVAERWSDAQIADRFLRVLTGHIPPAWLSAPGEVRYRQGCGLPEDRARATTRAVIEQHGRAALQLADKPELEASFVEWAMAEPAAEASPAAGEESPGAAPDGLSYPPADATVVAIEES